VILASVSIVVAYLLGSISSASIVGRIAGDFDMGDEPDGRISAASVYYRTGALPCWIMVVIMDISLAAMGVMVAKMLTDSSGIMMLSGLAAVAGHNWSIFLGLKGGLGATAMVGAMIVIIPWELFLGLTTAVLVLFFTHRSGLSTVVEIMVTSGAVLAQNGIGMLGMYPLTLAVLMLLKKLQVGRLEEQHEPVPQD
jgi:glycerol-3-phosphate acyltransferase PlsY